MRLGGIQKKKGIEVIPEPILVTFQVAKILEDLELPYLIGGSIASSTYGEPRATQDIDIVVDLKDHHIQSLIAAIADAFYIEEEDVRQAVVRNSSFNVVHLETTIKVDIFVLGPEAMDLEEIRRRQQIPLTPDSNRQVYVATPEDIILQKLIWFQKGGGISDRQWRDVLGVLKVQAKRLDWDYLKHWAESLNLSDLLQRAKEESDLEEENND